MGGGGLHFLRGQAHGAATLQQSYRSDSSTPRAGWGSTRVASASRSCTSRGSYSVTSTGSSAMDDGDEPARRLLYSQARRKLREDASGDAGPPRKGGGLKWGFTMLFAERLPSQDGARLGVTSHPRRPGRGRAELGGKSISAAVRIVARMARTAAPWWSPAIEASSQVTWSAAYRPSAVSACARARRVVVFSGLPLVEDSSVSAVEMNR
jgi:hypothetical protein